MTCWLLYHPTIQQVCCLYLFPCRPPLCVWFQSCQRTLEGRWSSLWPELTRPSMPHWLPSSAAHGCWRHRDGRVRGHQVTCEYRNIRYVPRDQPTATKSPPSLYIGNCYEINFPTCLFTAQAVAVVWCRVTPLQMCFCIFLPEL